MYILINKSRTKFILYILQKISGICLAILTEERKQWRKDHPYVCEYSTNICLYLCILRLLKENFLFFTIKGFYARPMKNEEGLDLLTWQAGIPGKKGVIIYIYILTHTYSCY